MAHRTEAVQDPQRPLLVTTLRLGGWPASQPLAANTSPSPTFSAGFRTLRPLCGDPDSAALGVVTRLALPRPRHLQPLTETVLHHAPPVLDTLHRPRPQPCIPGHTFRLGAHRPGALDPGKALIESTPPFLRRPLGSQRGLTKLQGNVLGVVPL